MQFCSFPGCHYPNFAIDKVTRLPYCHNHQTRRTDFDKRSIVAKAMAKEKSLSTKVRGLQNSEPNKAILLGKGIIKDNSLEAWFLLQMNVSERICDNCGMSLSHYNQNDWRGSMHHIVDKSPTNGCPSVACNPLNHLVLCKWKCHQIWHQSFEAASKMPVFSKAQEKFLLFQRFIAPDELRKVNPYLFQT